MGRVHAPCEISFSIAKLITLEVTILQGVGKRFFYGMKEEFRIPTILNF